MKILLLLLTTVSFLMSSFAQETGKINTMIIPQPQEIKIGNSYFSFKSNTKIIFNNEVLSQQASIFSENIERILGVKIITLDSHDDKSETGVLFLNIVKYSLNLGDEGYHLKVEKNKIIIEANTIAGTYYGLQSLFQLVLLNADLQSYSIFEIKIPTLEINDSPRFAYRGMHLDVGRHMFPPKFIKKYIDLLTYYKFNTFHWHLTEDQGWRIEIKKYPNATVMSWRGTDGGIAAAQQGHDAIMTPGSHCYFDHYQSDKRENEPLAIGGFTSLEKVYSYEPIPELLNSDEAKYILGSQGNVWTEYMETPEHVEYMILPRMAALSEVNWASEKNWELFKNKINEQFLIYDRLGFNYCDHPY